MPAKGSAEWKGDVPTGSETFTAGDTISGEYSFKSRFEDGPGANPEQLIAAAHASCFSRRAPAVRQYSEGGGSATRSHPPRSEVSAQIGRTCSACGPLAPRTAVYSTRWLSWRLR